MVIEVEYLQRKRNGARPKPKECAGMSESFVGEIRPIGFTYAPQGWAMCDGHSVSIPEYSTLFALIGTTFGGDGNMSFNVPNMQARVTVHQGTNGPSVYTIGQAAGNEMVTLSGANFPAHSHVLSGASSGTGANAPAGNVVGALPNVYVNETPGNAMNPATLTPTLQTNEPHENRQPYQVLNWIIALYGIYPGQ